MFRTVSLSITRSFFLYTQQTCMTYTTAVCTVKNGLKHMISYNIEFHENASSKSRVVPFGLADRQTDMTKLMAALRFFL